MKRMTGLLSRSLLAFVVLAFATPWASLADVKFTKLSDDQFIIHHRKQSMFGAEAKAVKTTYREAAAVCLAAGFSHLEIKETNTGER